MIERPDPDEANHFNETLNRLIEDGIALGKIIQNPEITNHCNNCGFIGRNAWYGQLLFENRYEKLTTPVAKVIATYTADEEESCTIKVRL